MSLRARRQQLGVVAGDALMVGDSAPDDGAATRLGINALILTWPKQFKARRGFDAVIDLVG